MASDRQFSWRRSLAWAVSLALHLGLLVAMTRPRDAAPPGVVVDVALADAMVPVDLAPPPERTLAAQGPVPMPDDVSRVRAPSPRDKMQQVAALARTVEREAPATEDVPPLAAKPEAPASASVAPAPVARTIAFLDDEARALLPQEDLYSANPPPREGDYFTPGDGSEDDVFYRPRALDPNPSRFARAWRPRGSLIDDWLGRLVEKASGKVSVPLNAKFSLVCGTVAGIAGSCTIVRNGGTGVIVQRPPPAPWDRSNRVQCRELRQAMEDAEEAVQVAYFLDRLSALCSPGTETGIDTRDDAAGNDEARREAGLPEDPSAPAAPPVLDQRDL